MPLDPNTAVIVGVGQISHHAAGLDDALSPAELMAEAIRRAASDAGLASVPDVDSIRVVSTLSWRVADPARQLAALLGIATKRRGSAHPVATARSRSSTRPRSRSKTLDPASSS
jgi:acetyl-CoA acetyltransferase